MAFGGGEGGGGNYGSGGFGGGTGGGGGEGNMQDAAAGSARAWYGGHAAAKEPPAPPSYDTSVYQPQLAGLLAQASQNKGLTGVQTAAAAALMQLAGPTPMPGERSSASLAPQLPQFETRMGGSQAQAEGESMGPRRGGETVPTQSQLPYNPLDVLNEQTSQIQPLLGDGASRSSDILSPGLNVPASDIPREQNKPITEKQKKYSKQEKAVVENSQRLANTVQKDDQDPLFPKNASLTKKGALIIDFFLAELKGRTPVLLQGNNSSSGTASNNSNPWGDDVAGIVSTILSMKTLGSRVQAEAELIEDPEIREQYKENAVARFAQAARVDVDDPIAVVYGSMINSPISMNVQTDALLKDPALASVRATIFSGDMDKIPAALKEAQPVINAYSDKKEMSEGLNGKVGALVKASGLEGTPDNPITMPQLIEANSKLPVNKQISPSGMDTVGRSAGIQKTYNILSDKRIEQINEAEDNRNPPEPKDYAPQVFVLPDGRRRTSKDRGLTYIEGGKTYPMPDGNIPLNLAKDSKVPELLGGTTNPEIKAMREQEIAVRKLVRLIDIADPLITKERLGAVGGIAGTVTMLVSQYDAMSELLGKRSWKTNPDDPDNKLADIEVTPDELRRVAEEMLDATEIVNTMAHTAEERGRLRSIIVGMAYAAAAQEGQTGRGASDRDIMLFLQRLGDDPSPAVFKRTLNGLREDSIANLDITWGVLNRYTIDGKNPFGTMKPLTIDDIRNPKSSEQLRNLSPFKGWTQDQILDAYDDQAELHSWPDDKMRLFMERAEEVGVIGKEWRGGTMMNESENQTSGTSSSTSPAVDALNAAGARMNAEAARARDQALSETSR